MLSGTDIEINFQPTPEAIQKFQQLKFEIYSNSISNSISKVSKKILSVIEKTEKLIQKERGREELLCNDALFEIYHYILSPSSQKGINIFKSTPDEFIQKWSGLLIDYKPTLFLILENDPAFETNQSYNALGMPFFEIDKNQIVLNMQQIINAMHMMPYDEISSFIFVVDEETGMVRFSPGAKTSHHINVFDGRRAGGAGEVYFKKSLDGIELVELNNRSGLYLPNDQFLTEFKSWFADCGINTMHSKIVDERAKQVEDIVGERWLMRV